MGSVLLSIFRRYRLDDLANLYESKCEELERLVSRGYEIGSKAAELRAATTP
jgi:hypothetical protein